MNTSKQFTIETAIKEAKGLVYGKIGKQIVCVDMVKGRSESEVLSEEDWNDVVNDLFFDTIYWETGSF